MSFLIRRLILIGVITSLPACAIINTFKDKLKSYEVKETQFPYRHSSYDFKVAWNTLQTGDDTVIDGLIKNVRNVQVREIDLYVLVLDTDGRFLSDGEVFPVQLNLLKNEFVPFSIKLKDAIISKGKVLNFVISYRINDGSWYGRSEQSSFKVGAATGVAIEEQNVIQK